MASARTPLTQDQTALVEEVAVRGGATTREFVLVDDENARTYEAIAGDTVLGGLTYNVAGDDRLVLVAVAVFPQFRGQGVATELIRRVLDGVRSRGETVTILCPIVWAFIDRNPGYADLIDPELPGLDKRPAVSSGVRACAMTGSADGRDDSQTGGTGGC